jgi:hypothetical protein
LRATLLLLAQRSSESVLPSVLLRMEEEDPSRPRRGSQGH